MAIGFARLEFIKRSSGNNAIAKASYNSRERLYFEGNLVLSPRQYDFSDRESCAYHEIILPENVDDNFQNMEVLWNHAEKIEGRRNSQVAAELLLALPDDLSISNEDRIEMTRNFVEKYFVSERIGVQVDIHKPEKHISIGEDRQSIEVKEHNHHAHILLTTRRFREDGKGLGEKARDLLGQVMKGRVVSANRWGDLWTDFQNDYFREKGLSLRVDDKGLISQKHLGPVRMRSKNSFSMEKENEKIREEGLIKEGNIGEVLKRITDKQSIFNRDDVEHFLNKHTLGEDLEKVKEAFWKQKGLVQLLHKDTHKALDKFTSQTVLDEEVKLLRIADRIQKKKSFSLKGDLDSYTKNLNEEQKIAYDKILKGQRLTCLQGYAGTGKSYLLVALKDAYQSKRYQIRAFGADQSAAEVLKGKGFSHAENIHRFLFSAYYGKRALSKKEVWFVDEAGKLSNPVLLELLKKAEKYKARVILSGDHAQLPSVSRGGMFKVFCERFGSETLSEIQRQEDLNHRKLIKKLAHGELGAAIQELHNRHCIQWVKNKDDALDQVIRDWARERTRSPGKSSILIAHTNKEVKAINDTIHLLRQERKEIEGKEFSCDSYHGKIFVSVGDKIEFRGNDSRIGVLNHMRGTLISAEPECFTVKIEEQKKTRLVHFNPHTFHRFQLAYATTCHGAQGKDADFAYIIHNPIASKESVYVSMSRHFKRVKYYVSEEDSRNLARLKAQVGKSHYKENTLDYSTHKELLDRQSAKDMEKEIKDLKSSSSYLDKYFGYSFDLLEWGKKKGNTIIQKYKDRKVNDEFFEEGSLQAKIQREEKARMEVKEFSKEERPGIELEKPSIVPQDLANEIFKEEKKERSFSNDRGLEKEGKDEGIPFKSETTLSKEKKEIFSRYSTERETAFTLQSVTKADAELTGKDLKDSQYFSDWQKACGKRNETAYDLKSYFKQSEVKDLFGEGSAKIIEEQARKHEYFLDRSSKKVDNEKLLKENLEPLLYRLFPDGPCFTSSKEFKFRSKGSLSVCRKGEREGCFYDFENNEGGGLFKLIQKELGKTPKEAREWASDFIGQADKIERPMSFSLQQNKIEEKDWVSIKPDPRVQAPRLENIKGKNFHTFFKEVERYAYKDEKGDLLHYVLRLEKKSSGKKLFFPLSYGYFKGNEDKPFWNTKGFSQGEKRSLYNLNLLKEKPLTKVLVVEGEKTANRAQERFQNCSYDIVCVTWQGGASAVGKTDWSPLIGRDVVVWPDNDKAGFKAGEDVCFELRKFGMQRLEMLSRAKLQSYPEKWDLADPLPEHEEGEYDLVRKSISSKSKGCDPNRVLDLLKEKVKEENRGVMRKRVNDILFHVDNRRRQELVEARESDHEINFTIIQETASLFNQRKELQKSLRERFSAEGVLLESLTQQVLLFKAEHGTDPSSNQVEAMKEAIRGLGNNPGIERNLFDDRLNKELKTLALEKGLEKACKESLKGEKDREKLNEIVKKETLKELSQVGKNIQREKLFRENLQKQQELQRSMDRGLDRGM